MSRRMRLVSLAFVIVACDSSPSGPNGDDNPVVDTSRISSSVLLDHLNFLAADSLYGRRAGSEHERRSAEYVRDRFIEFDLEPGAPDYLQEFTIPFSVDGQMGLVSQNVLGVLRGNGSLAGQWVILGAHYDHLGFDGSSEPVLVYNGADDNASGTALMLEIAGYLSEYFAAGGGGESDRRSVMFQAYGAEEVGLVGSFHFCGQPTVVMDSIVAMVNLDMVGRLRDDALGLIGLSSSSDWDALLSGTNTESLSLTIVEGLLNRSDQYCFYQRQKPVLFLHTGLHPEYHTPLDDVALINEAGMVRVGNFAINAMLNLLHTPDRPTFAPAVIPFDTAMADLRPVRVH
ncbi:MAG: M28 family peptidase [Gemmatimonadales bacterium]